MTHSLEQRVERPDQEVGHFAFSLMKIEDIPTICAIEQEAFTTPWSAGAFHNKLTNNQFARTKSSWNAAPKSPATAACG
ncbi:hypothetical protein [Paenibacillus piri]|uniref:hypothetical protein n=1 Tax=Paenibacillus piri TaxID=2547395 RepID=UPI001FE98B9D|nr:hypothetical protein [Paenibacillus piri]